MTDKRMLGLGGAPTRCSTLPTESKAREEYPIAGGVLDYFPDAIAAIARVSLMATKQHHPDADMHWDRAKSGQEADKLMRHFLQRGLLDEDGLPHSAKMAWRALALLQKEIENGQPVKIVNIPPKYECLCSPDQAKEPGHNPWCAHHNSLKREGRQEVKDGPYCDNCEGLATRISLGGTPWCVPCLDEEFNEQWADSYFTVLESFGKRKDYQR